MIARVGYMLQSTAGSIVIDVMALFIFEMLRLALVKFFWETLPKFLPSGAISGMTISGMANPTQTIGYLNPGTAAFAWLVCVSVFVTLGAIGY